MSEQFDVVIIGSGMGGLVCGDILSREGYRVCIIEKNKQAGGALQVYSRDGVTFDAAVHYIGGLAPGQTLHQVCNYLGLLDKVNLIQLDKEFDRIYIGDDPHEYAHAQGYVAFKERLVKDFPNEVTAIEEYCNKLVDVCNRFPMYTLRNDGNASEKEPVLNISAKEYISSITNNKKLQAVLSGTNLLYAGHETDTPFYVHALIQNSYIESAWKFADSGAQLVNAILANIRNAKGQIIRGQAVTKIVDTGGTADHVILESGEKISAKFFISNIHPKNTLDLVESSKIKPAYRNRTSRLENTVAAFMVNLTLKSGSFKYHNHNFYYHDEGMAWSMASYGEGDWPRGYAIYSTHDKQHPDFASSITVLTYMRYEELHPWRQTYHTTKHKMPRGEDYEEFKRQKADQLINKVSKRFPAIKAHIHSCYVASPLTFRDYLGTDDGSLYGIAKNYSDAVKTSIPTRTGLPNLFLTGQNINLHGILGTTISALITCSELMGNSNFIQKIKDA